MVAPFGAPSPRACPKGKGMKAHPAPFKKQGRRSVGYFSAGCLKIASGKEGAHSSPQRLPGLDPAIQLNAKQDGWAGHDVAGWSARLPSQMQFSNSRRRNSQRSAAPVFYKARGAPSFLSLRTKSEGWSAERRNHQPTPCGAARFAKRARLSALHRGDFGLRDRASGVGQRPLRPPDPGAFAPFVLPSSSPSVGRPT